MLNSLPFPFQYAFEYVFKGMRHSPHNFSDSFQLHIIQDFEFDEDQKEILYKSKYSSLVNHLKTAGNPVQPGWQTLGTRLLTFRKHLFGCYLTPEYHLLCFNVSKKMIY
jgi:hypothetical protein